MGSISQQNLTLDCPKCGKQFQAVVSLVVLPGSEELENLRKGVLNSVACTHCSEGGLLAVPFVLYQPENSRAVCFIPQSERLDQEQQQAVVNELAYCLQQAVGDENLQAGSSLEAGITDSYEAIMWMARQGAEE